MDRTSYAGKEVITRQEPDMRHPRWGYDNPVKLDGATSLLLSDGTTVVVCNSCDYNGLTGYEPYAKPEGEIKDEIHQSDSVLAHINGKHHPNKANRRTSFYDDERLRVAIKIWLKWRNTNTKNWTKKACEELDRMGIKPFRGDNWNVGQLGGLVRDQIRKPKFKNLKAAHLTEEDQAYLASLVRESAREAAAAGPTTVASNARITEKKPYEHKPVDFVKIIEEQEAAKQQEEVVVPAGDPVLTFADLDAPAPKVVEDEKPVPSQTERLAPPPRRDTPRPVPALSSNGFVHVADLPDGTPLFTYKGQLMVGKPVKGVEV